MALAKTFGKNVRRVRKERALSQEELAEAVELAVTYVGQIERAIRNPTLKVVEDLARAPSEATRSIAMTNVKGNPDVSVISRILLPTLTATAYIAEYKSSSVANSASSGAVLAGRNVGAQT